MTASIKNNGGSQFDVTIGGIVIGTFDATGFVGVKDLSITAAKLADAVKPLGVGQTRQNVTASRAMATNYTNSTGRTISVNVTLSGANAATAYASFSIDGVLSGYSSDAAAASSTSSMSFIVRAGETYSVQNANGSFSAVSRWTEIR